jgi:hypothetical protein
MRLCLCFRFKLVLYSNQFCCAVVKARQLQKELSIFSPSSTRDGEKRESLIKGKVGEQSDHSADVFQVSSHPEPCLIAKLSWGREMDGGHLVFSASFSEVLISKPNHGLVQRGLKLQSISHVVVII